MIPLQVLFLLITFNQYNALTIIKSATITPNTLNLQNNGVKVIELHAITRTASEWTLQDPGYSQRLHLQLTLNTSWGFHPTENTTLKIEVNANAHTTPDNQLMVAFTQTGSNKYFTTRISIDPTDDHIIYPQCIWTPPYNQSYVNKDIVSQVNTISNGLPQYLKATDGWMGSLYNPELLVAQRMVTAPLTFILFNNPQDKYMLFTYTNPNVMDRSCGFAQMDANRGMDIYFAANGQPSSVNISSFIITHIYETTNAPTSDPTVTPTTDNPTLPPIGDTTRDPTTNPTTWPTKMPTNNPTKIPTNNPTVNSSKLSSINPSLSVVGITHSPSYSPMSNIVYVSTTSLSNNNVNNSGAGANKILYIIITGSVCSILIVIIIALIAMLMWKKRKINAIKNQRTLSDLQQDRNSQNIVTDMTVVAKANNIDENEDVDDLYDEVQSIDTVGAATTGSDGNSLFNVKDVSVDAEDDNINTEGMYNAANATKAAGCIFDEGESDEESEITSKGTTNIVKSNGEYIDENVNYGDEVKEWLNEIVELPQYYDIFVSNGLNSLKLIQKCNDNQSLIDLGIELKGHRIIIMKYIQQITTEGDSV